MNEINIDDYINLIMKNNKVKGERCLLCHMNDTIENLIILDCKHYFHKDCLSSKKSIKCPYCDKKTNLLKPLIVKNKKDKKVKKGGKIKDKLCKVILKSGARKGEQCGRTNCGYHKKKDIIV